MGKRVGELAQALRVHPNVLWDLLEQELVDMGAASTAGAGAGGADPGHAASQGYASDSGAAGGDRPGLAGAAESLAASRTWRRRRSIRNLNGGPAAGPHQLMAPQHQKPGRRSDANLAALLRRTAVTGKVGGCGLSSAQNRSWCCGGCGARELRGLIMSRGGARALLLCPPCHSQGAC